MLVLRFSTLLCCLISVFGFSRVDPLVETKLGLIRGLHASDGDYSMFLGIPYARVNYSNPFGPAIPYPKFDETFNAFEGQIRCPQKDPDGPSAAEGTLDCLRLNIHVPNSASAENQLPVMVFIHGGSFIRGHAGIYGPKFLVKHDVILVGINYRLDVYGLLCLDTAEVPGNQALKDQLAALRWVKEHIEAFGGDINKITVFGESVGGRFIDLHLRSPHEKVFNSAIIQSGTSFTRDTFKDADTSIPIRLCEVLGLPTDSLTEALTFLSSVDPKLVVEAVSELEHVFTPCVEKDFENVESFIVDHPVNVELPKVKNMPIMIGYNNDEQVVRYADKPAEYFDGLNLIYDRLKEFFVFDDDTLKEMTDLVRHFYMGDAEISKDTMWELIEFDSEFSYSYPTERSIRKFMENGSGNVFKYVFSYKGGRNLFSVQKNVPVGGAGHADELGYLFDLTSLPEDAVPLDTDPIMIDVMTTLWTNFAKYSNPTPEMSSLVPVIWEPVAVDKNNYLNLNLSPSLEIRDLQNQTAFWDLFFKHNWKAQKGYHD